MKQDVNDQQRDAVNSLNYLRESKVIDQFIYQYMILTSPRGDRMKSKIRTMFPPPPQQWYDVQDEDGIWKVGFCERSDQKFKVISLDGYHPCHNACFCDHAGKIAPIRTYTRGLTVPQNSKALRKIISIKEVQSISGKLSLFQLQSNQLQNTPENIKGFLRTELLITVDKIVNTPFEILGTIKLIDIQINKLFISVIEFYLKLLQSSKKFISFLDSNQTALELYKATYEMSLITQIILGVHKRSKSFYESTLNRTITSEGFLDCFIKSQAGILPFKLFFKSISGLKSVGDNDMIIFCEALSLFVSMCEKYQKQFVEGTKYQSTTRLIVEEIISTIKIFCQKNPELKAQWKGKVQIISRIQTLFLKLFPNKPCIIRKIIDGDIQQQRETYRTKLQNQMQAERKSKMNEKQNDKMKQLEAKITNLEGMINKMQTINLHGEKINVEKRQIQDQPTQNLGEQAFLGSLQWALEAGDINTCKKLITWRRSLLKLGRITGWQIALAVGMKTFKKKQISPDDIIQANYNFLLKQNQRGKTSTK